MPPEGYPAERSDRFIDSNWSASVAFRGEICQIKNPRPKTDEGPPRGRNL